VDDAEIVFQVQTPLDRKTISRHIRHAYALGHPHALGEPQSLSVIANGPSARQAPQDGPVLALNGALKFVREPDFYACCDPQGLVADFLEAPPKKTTYYIASKCHPKVFARLIGRDIRLWDIDDYVAGGIPSAPSITIVALYLMARIGWRVFDVWGWDCCFGSRGEHHAADQPFQGERITNDVGGRIFETTTTWAAEAQSAVIAVSLLEYFGVEVRIHGDGMLRAVIELAKSPTATTAKGPRGRGSP